MIARRAISVFALLSYLAAVVVFPVLHRLHHLAHGADHVHTAAGTIYSGAHDHDHADENEDDPDETHDLGHYHAQFDRDLVTLGLGDVAVAGTLTIDCSYTELSLATCEATATANHPRTFGDDLLAHTHHGDHAPPDPDHGKGSLEHTQASVHTRADERWADKRTDDLVAADDAGRQRRLEWAVLMKRAYAVDVLVCPRCAGPMRLVSVIQDERVARRILEHLGLPARAPPRGRPWRSGQQLAVDDPDGYDGIDELVLT